MGKAKFSTRLRQVADIIEKQPDFHDQDTWGEGGSEKRSVEIGDTVRVLECGLRHCVAGWLAVLERKHPVSLSWRCSPSWEYVSDRRGAIEGEDGVLPIDEWAGDRFGLTWEDRVTLFSEGATPRDPEMSFPDALRAVADGAPISEVFVR